MWLDDEKTKKINDLLEKMQKNIVSPADLERFITFLLKTVEKSKGEIVSLSTENIKSIKEGIAYLEEYTQDKTNALDTKTNAVVGQFDAKLALLKALLVKIEKIKATPGKDGIDGLDADPEAVVSLVLAKIKLPEYKETVLDGRKEIIEKINTGKKTDLKIELTQIEGTKFKKEMYDWAIGVLDQRTQFLINKQTSSGGGTWGSITGTLSNQTDLQTALNLKVPYTGATTDLDLGTHSLTTPLLIGGSAVDSKITYKSTTGVGTTTAIAHQWLGGTNGATVIATMLNNGNVGIGTVAPEAQLDVRGSGAGSGSSIFVRNSSALTANHQSQLVLINGTTLGAASDRFWQIRSIVNSGATDSDFTYQHWNGTSYITPFTILGSGNVGIGTTAPTSRIHGVTTLSAATGDEVAYSLNYTTNKATSGNDTGLLINMTDTASPGTSTLLNLMIGGATSRFSVSNSGNVFNNGGSFYINNGQGLDGMSPNDSINVQTRGMSTASRWALTLASGTNTQTSGSAGAVRITPIYNQTSGTAANTDLLINRTETAVGSGAQLLIDAQVGGVSKFSVDNTGAINAVTSYAVAGTKVVGTQVAAIGLDADTDANKITAIIAALRAHGLMGPNA